MRLSSSLLLALSLSACHLDVPLSEGDDKTDEGDTGLSGGEDSGDDLPVDTAGEDSGNIDSGEEEMACTVAVPDDFDTIQRAIDAVSDGATVCVRAGTWTENLELDGRALSLVGLDGRDTTVIDGRGRSSVLTVVNSSDVSFAGFTLINGSAEYGGGIFAEGSTLALADCSVSGNEAGENGGGLHLTDVTLNVTDSYIRSNHAGNAGAGILASGSRLTLDGLDLSSNLADGWGGAGGYVYESSLSLSNAEVRANQAPSGSNTGGGAGLYLRDVSGEIRGTVFAGNESVARGGAIYMESGNDMAVTNVTFVGNIALNGGALFLLYAECQPVFVNVILAYNESTDQAGGVWDYSASPSWAWSDLYGNDPGDYYGDDSPVGEQGNMAVAPDFIDFDARVDARSWDLHLDAGSPLVDAGDPSMVDDDGSRSDVGAYGG